MSDETRFCGYQRPHDAHYYEATGFDRGTEYQRWPFDCPGVDRAGLVGEPTTTHRPTPEPSRRERSDLGRSATDRSADRPVPTAMRDGDENPTPLTFSLPGTHEEPK